jgi:hypothetical protein
MRQSYHRILTQHEIMAIATFFEQVVFLVINATGVFAVSLCLSRIFCCRRWHGFKEKIAKKTKSLI